MKFKKKHGTHRNLAFGKINENTPVNSQQRVAKVGGPVKHDTSLLWSWYWEVWIAMLIDVYKEINKEVIWLNCMK